MKLIVQYENINYEINDEDAICNRILSDPVYAAAYMQQNLATQNADNSEEVLENNESEEAGEQQSGASCSSASQLEKESSWEHRTVLLFLEECRKQKQDLRNPKIRRRTVFLKIKAAMQGKGYSFKESSLEKKLANLKIRYNLIIDNNKKTSTGRGRMSWPYFDAMSQVYEEEVSVRDAPTVSSLIPASSEMIASSACVASTSTTTTEQMQKKSAGVRAKFVALEEEKLAIAREVLQELKELRLLRQRKLDFEVQKYNDEKENRHN